MTDRSATPRIALIHAVVVAMEPVEEAFKALWPEAGRINILDDSLSRDRARTPALSQEMHARIATLAGYARGAGADAILFTCSAFGPAIEAAALAHACPVLKPNEAMFEAALGIGSRIGMLATFEPSVASMEQEFGELASLRGVAAAITTVCVPAAMQALQAGDSATHNGLLAEAAAALSDCDAIMLAQFSTSRAKAAVAARAAVPILTSPGAAVARLRTLLAA